MCLEKIAIDRLRTASELSLHYIGKPLMVCISGGKDSTVLQLLAIRSGVPVQFVHSHTTADAPETVYYVRNEFKRLDELGFSCDIQFPVYRGKPVTMWSLISQKPLPPTRQVRYCCSVLKENCGSGRFISTGVRWSESQSRSSSRFVFEKQSRNPKNQVMLNSDNDDARRLFESCSLKGKRVVNPIIDWTDSDVWDYLYDAHCSINPLYSEGFCRVGCVGCPLSHLSKRSEEFIRWPKYASAYVRAFDKVVELRKNRGLVCSWRNGRELFDWWMERDVVPGQFSLFEDYDLLDI